MRAHRHRNIVLLLTHSGDHFTVDRVAAALEQRGASAVRLDTDQFPRRLRLSAALGGTPRHLVSGEGPAVDAADVRSVWARRIWPPEFDEDLDPRFAASCARESMAALGGFLDGLEHARWVNDIESDQLAGNKLRQLRLAERAGFRIPRTLLTNDPDELARFYDQSRGDVVAKLLRPLSVGMTSAPLFVPTSTVELEDLTHAGLLRHSPMLFQERIAKERELRIAYVDGRVFTGAVDAAASAVGATDWRLADTAECPWERDEIPEEVAASLRLLMAELGLIYGAIDIIRTPSGEHVFLEVNPGGEWGMLEHDLGLPISESIAEALLA